MRLSFGLFFQRLANDRSSLLVADASATARSRSVLLDSYQAVRCVARTPASRLLASDTHQRTDLSILQPIGRVQNDRRTFRKANRHAPTTRQPLKRLALQLTQTNLDCSSHARGYVAALQ
jgi:hypothetical protein